MFSQETFYENQKKYKNTATICKEVNSEVLELEFIDYNCGGFALGFPKWYLPYSHDEEEHLDYYDEMNYYQNESYELDVLVDKYEEDIMRNGDSRQKLNKLCTARGRIMADYMLQTIPFIREIKSQKELQDDEYLILFRAAYDDFHFLRRFKDGTWAHKAGGSEIEEIPPEKINEIWHRGSINYTGKVFLFAVKYNH